MRKYDVLYRDPEMEAMYPSSDGNPRAESSVQFDWMHLIHCNLDSLFEDRDDVFFAADLFWYPVEGAPSIRMAPDILVAFGRPSAGRMSYLQWREENIPLHVVFELPAPWTPTKDLWEKREFYERYGVEEYYEYNPFDLNFRVWLRDGTRLRATAVPESFVSPRLGITFSSFPENPLKIYHPNGKRFLSYVELYVEYQHAKRQRQLEEALREIEGLKAENSRLQDELNSTAQD